ncbi:MAG: translation elongation factor Ts, elongation factor Ts [Parcubacteria group bacterium]|nr:translation elongation factor Ts, elongation factor Ts [Parcubacteria group bacterium]
MTTVSTEEIKALREETGLSIMQCKKALEDAGGDREKARILLQKKGSEIASKKGDRTLGAGTVASYIHASGAIGVLVELSCETDFVAKNPEFKAIAYDIAMHVAAVNPKYLKKEEISEEDRNKVMETFKAEVADKPADMQEKILAGKVDSYFADKVLLEQPYIKNPDQKIQDLVNGAVQKFGERTEIRRYVRFSVSE